jgi:hypothetical protein
MEARAASRGAVAVEVRPSSCSRVGEAVKPWPWTRGLRGVSRGRGRRAVAVEAKSSSCSRGREAVEPWQWIAKLSSRGRRGVAPWESAGW